jgi:hypothetical protein
VATAGPSHCTLPERIEDFAPALHDALGGRGGRRFNVIIDALDETAEARAVIAKIILPIAETCAHVGAQVVVGTRPRDDEGDLLTAFGPARSVIDLDDEQFFAEADLAAYAQATLQVERQRNPYAPDVIAVPVAARIAELRPGLGRIYRHPAHDLGRPRGSGPRRVCLHSRRPRLPGHRWRRRDCPDLGRGHRDSAHKHGRRDRPGPCRVCFHSRWPCPPGRWRRRRHCPSVGRTYWHPAHDA